MSSKKKAHVALSAVGKKPPQSPARGRMSADEVFNLLDLDQDGKITTAELREALLACGIPIEIQESLYICEDFLKHSDGLVELKQFKALLREYKPDLGGSPIDFYSSAFEQLQIDEEGMIEVAYLKHVLHKCGQKMSKGEIDSFLKGLDKTEEGKISLQVILDRLTSTVLLS